jgi:hypothetical protein
MVQVGDKTQSTKWLSARAWLQQNPGVFSPETFYKYLNENALPCIHVGKKFLVPADLLDRIMTGGDGLYQRGASL